MRQISDEVLAVLGECRVENSILYLPDRTLARELYVAVDKVLKALGGKWSRRDKGHVFEDDPCGAIDAALLTGTYTSLSQDLQFFETQAPVVKRLIADIEPGMKVLEPSAGKGAIAIPLIEKGCDVHAVEKHEPFREHLVDNGVRLIAEPDFMNIVPSRSGEFDAVVGNPPFTKQQDISHVSHMIDFLQSGGLLRVVMSAGIRFRTNRKTTEFLRKLEEMSYHEWYDLPEGSFKPSGTNVNTVLVSATK